MRKLTKYCKVRSKYPASSGLKAWNLHDSRLHVVIGHVHVMFNTRGPLEYLGIHELESKYSV